MSTPDSHLMGDVADGIREAAGVLRAYMAFHDEVAATAIDMAGRGDPTSLRLLNAMKDLQARTGEFAIEEDDDGRA